ncbi:MAG: hypothetical protein R3B13_28755 [Polyangiaceae bacterium]
MRRLIEFSALISALGALASCGGPPPSAPPKPKVESAEEEVFRVASVWRAAEQEHGFLPPPNAVETFERRIESELVLTRGQGAGEERVVVKERLVLRNGTRLDCEGKGAVRPTVRFGRHRGLAALELTRPAMLVTRRCNGSPPEAALELAGGPARLELRSDQLVTYEPLGDERVYLPAD